MPEARLDGGCEAAGGRRPDARSDTTTDSAKSHPPHPSCRYVVALIYALGGNMKFVWGFLTLVFGALTVGGVLSGIQSLQNAGSSGAHNTYSVGSGILDGALQLLIIGLLALATRGCYRRASRGSQPRTIGPDRRPWER